jgi:hypothetical protein
MPTGYIISRAALDRYQEACSTALSRFRAAIRDGQSAKTAEGDCLSATCQAWDQLIANAIPMIGPP